MTLATECFQMEFLEVSEKIKDLSKLRDVYLEISDIEAPLAES
ncbi:MAG: hypothetical protein NWE89_01670 [Candidatus Bathyarchaeota archaeon]|nr:hypothetical protein [Candidatus Bathyarchaeota archaeon]